METHGNTATARKNDLSQLPPEAYVVQLAFGALISQALFVAAKLGIADLLTEKPLPVHKLATAADVDERALYRVLRSLASVGVFEETDPKVFALTPYAEVLRSDAPKSLRNGAIFMGEEWHWRVWGNLMHSVKSGEPAWGKVHGAQVFEYLQENPAHYEIFNRAMTDMTAGTAPAVVRAYDFSGFATVADIAGGHGLLLAQILKANPDVKGILFDVPAVIDGAHGLLEKENVAKRVKTITGDFFESVPAGADAYLMKHIIHDWDDAKATRILKNIATAMKAHSKLLLVEIVVPAGNDPDLAKLMDLEMLVSPGGVERTSGEYRELLAKAGLTMTRIVGTESAYSIVEAVK
jgi:hypothetical protein